MEVSQAADSVLHSTLREVVEHPLQVHERNPNGAFGPHFLAMSMSIFVCSHRRRQPQRRMFGLRAPRSCAAQRIEGSGREP